MLNSCAFHSLPEALCCCVKSQRDKKRGGNASQTLWITGNWNVEEVGACVREIQILSAPTTHYAH